MIISRRNILKGGLIGGPLAALGAYAYGRGPGRKNIKVEKKDVFFADLPRELDGFRIAHLSDFHIDPLIEQEHHAKAVEITNRLKPDLVALTGDFVSDRSETITELSPQLGKFDAKYGVMASLGNHDGWSGARRVAKGLERDGTRVLENDGLSLSKEGIPLHVGGVESVWAGQPDPVKAFANSSKEEFGLLLCHEPDVFPDYTGEGSPISLMLAGHTHGGQVCCPGIGALELPRFGKRFPHGLFESGEAQLHVNPGIGTVDIHVRFWCPPEVTLLTLRQKV